MIASTIKTILLNYCIILYLSEFAVGVKTFQVRRINYSTFMVTSLPEFDYDNYKNMINFKRTKGKLLSFSDDTFEAYDMTTIPIGGKRNKAKVPALYINKIRENYFRHYYGTLKKSNKTTMSLIPSSITDKPILTNSSAIALKSANSGLIANIDKARRLASVLIGEGQYYTSASNMIKLNMDDARSKKQRRVRKVTLVFNMKRKNASIIPMN